MQVTQWLVDEGYDTWLDVCFIEGWGKRRIWVELDLLNVLILK